MMTTEDEFPSWISEQAATSLRTLIELGFTFTFGTEPESVENVFGDRFADERFDRVVIARGEGRVSYAWSGVRINNPSGPAPRQKQGALEDVLECMVKWLTEGDKVMTPAPHATNSGVWWADPRTAGTAGVRHFVHSRARRVGRCYVAVCGTYCVSDASGSLKPAAAGFQCGRCLTWTNLASSTSTSALCVLPVGSLPCCASLEHAPGAVTTFFAAVP
ncbi:hypothetical protein [Amycolatopsis sp. lyj-112]|uniref:hypothetical protein n=1 Tax=Amycolatopsis sp. lyj-112 TaxID=2789288 RepID=UPI00397BBCB6